jgi:hypothetical protein
METNRESGLGRYPDFLIKNDCLYVHYVNAKKILMFDSNDGQYVKSLDKHGRAYGEYLSCRIFDTANGCDYIAILDKSKLYKYDSAQNCVFESPKMKLGFTNMLKANPADENSFFVNDTRVEHISGKKSFNEYLTLIDSCGVVSRTLIQTGVDAFDGRAVFFDYDNKLKVINSSRDTIFNLSPLNELSVAYVITLGKYSKFKELEGKSSYNLILRRVIFENDDFIFFSGTLPEKNLPQIFSDNYNEDIASAILYDKNEKKTYALKKLPDSDYLGFVNDLDNGAPFLPFCSDGKKMYQIVDAGEFKQLADKYNVSRMKEVAAQLTEESNPVVVVVTMK